MPDFAAHSTFGLGTIPWGTKLRGEELDRLYDAFREAGHNFFDSAHVYAFWLPGGAGASERALGEIVRRRGDRENVILATKGGHPPMKGGYDRPERYLSREVIARDVAESLERLGVEAIDLYFLHRDDPRVPVGEIIDVLDEHVVLGRLGELGASNWTTARIEEANRYAAARGRRGFVASQSKFSLAVANPSKDPTVPAFDEQEIAWHAASGLTVCAYSATANGFFATNGVKGAGGWANPVSATRLRAANRVAGELRVTPNQVALAWLLHQPFPVVPLLGTTNVEHLRDALAAAAVRLSPDHLRALTAAPTSPP
jgi:aryl-alcohol dehydrogenase-like predicted oxidoreductase